MTFDLLVGGLIPFAFAALASPGPNNMMLMASGANFGFRKTAPHMLGIVLGHAFMCLCLGAGLIRVFDAYPLIKTILTWLSVAYLLFLAYKIATAASVEEGKAGGKPLTFLQAAAFQWVNPKAWFVAMYAITAYAADLTLVSVLTVALVFAAIGSQTVLFWTVLGQQATRILSNRTRLVAFNVTMALLLVASLYPVIFGQ